MDRLRDWLDENPRARPLLMFGLVGMLVFMMGVLIALKQRPPDPPLPPIAMTPSVTSPETPGGEPHVPTGGGEEHLGDSPRRPRTAWIQEKEVKAYADHGLNTPVVTTLEQWEEVSWIQESENWDQVRLKDGKEVWVPSKYVSFTRPMNLDKPNEAEVAVMGFYQAVARKDYPAAYSYLSGPWRAELSFDRFVEGYARTLNLRTEIANVVPLGPERYQVEVSMVADELGQDVHYLGSYVVEKLEGDWLMASGSLERTSATSPPRDVGLPAASETPGAMDTPGADVPGGEGLEAPDESSTSVPESAPGSVGPAAPGSVGPAAPGQGGPPAPGGGVPAPGGSVPAPGEATPAPGLPPGMIPPADPAPSPAT